MVSLSTRLHNHLYNKRAQNRGLGIGIALFILLYFTATVFFIIFA
jgi:hypothetical protein